MPWSPANTTTRARSKACGGHWPCTPAAQIDSSSSMPSEPAGLVSWSWRRRAAWRRVGVGVVDAVQRGLQDADVGFGHCCSPDCRWPAVPAQPQRQAGHHQHHLVGVRGQRGVEPAQLVGEDPARPGSADARRCPPRCSPAPPVRGCAARRSPAPSAAARKAARSPSQPPVPSMVRASQLPRSSISSGASGAASAPARSRVCTVRQCAGRRCRCSAIRRAQSASSRSAAVAR